MHWRCMLKGPDRCFIRYKSICIHIDKFLSKEYQFFSYSWFQSRLGDTLQHCWKFQRGRYTSMGLNPVENLPSRGSSSCLTPVVWKRSASPNPAVQTPLSQRREIGSFGGQLPWLTLHASVGVEWTLTWKHLRLCLDFGVSLEHPRPDNSLLGSSY